jgi:hypothetical protein
VPGEQFQLQVIQLSGGPLSIVPVPGVWSDKPLDPGVELVAFSRSQGQALAELLKEPACERLSTTDQVLADVRLAQQAESEKLELADVIDRAVQVASSLHDIFMEYLWARWENAALRNQQDLDRVMELFETPNLGYVARVTLLNLVISDVLSGQASASVVNRFCVALLRLLDLEQAAALHDNIIHTYLPNLLGLDSSNERAAQDIFREFPGDRQRAEQVLSSYQGSTPTVYLRDWLGR